MKTDSLIVATDSAKKSKPIDEAELEKHRIKTEPTDTILKNKTDKETDDGYLKVKSIFNYPDKHHIVKFSIPSLLYGNIPMIYDFKVAEHFSLEVQGGITFRSLYNDVWESSYTASELSRFEFAANPPLWQSKTNTKDMADNYNNYRYRNAEPGYSFGISPKFYFIGAGLKGFYIAPKFVYSVYNYSFQKMDVNGIRELKYDGSERMNFYTPTLDFGYQTFSSNGTFEINTSLGVVYANGFREDLGIDLSNNTYINGTKTINRVYPMLMLDIKKGFTLGRTFKMYSRWKLFHPDEKSKSETVEEKPKPMKQM